MGWDVSRHIPMRNEVNIRGVIRELKRITDECTGLPQYDEVEKVY